MLSLLSADKIKDLFYQALDRAPDDRPTFLSQACAGDAILLREVEALLSLITEHQDFLQEPLFDRSAADLAADVLDVDGTSPVSPRRVGPYRIIREVGRGGMGAVYLAARDDGHYDQQVAVKLIKRGMDSDEVVRRFRLERQILANLAHANISRLLDGGVSADGRPYFVMEFVNGSPIDEYADQEGLSIGERLVLFCRVCDAVQYAHERNIIHRDLKPGNVLITPEGTVKLLDFGIAKFLNPEQSTETTNQTDTAGRVLTPAYASPEQLHGSPLTKTSDVYSLGVLLYKLLTGHRPYAIPSRSSGDTSRDVIETDPEAPSKAISKQSRVDLTGVESGRQSIRPLRRALKGDLDNIVLMALRRNPTRRYSSVDLLSGDIRHHLSGLPVTARKDNLTYRTTKFLKRNKRYSISIVTVAIACAVLGLVLGSFTVRGKIRNSIAVMPLINATQDSNMDYLSDGITDDLINRLRRLPGLRVGAHDSVFNYKGKAIDAKSIGRDLDVEAVLLGRVSTDGVNIVVTSTLIDSSNNHEIWNKAYRGRPSDLQNIQDELAQDVAHELGTQVSRDTNKANQTSRTTDAQTYNLYLEGDFLWKQRSPQSLTKAIECFNQAVNSDPKYAPAYTGLAISHSLLGAYRFVAPDESFGKAKIEATKAIEIDPSLPEAHASLALIAWLYDWDWVSAEREFKRAIEINPSYPLAHHWYGLFLAEMSRFDEAISEEKRALQLDPVSSPTIADLGRIYFFARRYDEAMDQYKKAAELTGPVGDYIPNVQALYRQTGMASELRTLEEDPELKRALDAGGMKAYWRKRFELLCKLYTKKPADPYAMAEALARIGETDAAVKELNVAYQKHDHLMTQLKVNPEFDALGSNAGFNELLRRMNLAN